MTDLLQESQTPDTCGGVKKTFLPQFKNLFQNVLGFFCFFFVISFLKTDMLYTNIAEFADNNF